LDVRRRTISYARSREKTRSIQRETVSHAQPFIWKKIAAKSQELGKQISRTRVLQQIVSRRSNGFAFAVCGILLAFLPAQTLMEVRRVDLRLKLNVLAVCAVFVFVGAILLGAF
jgi:hypothetical protein